METRFVAVFAVFFHKFFVVVLADLKRFWIDGSADYVAVGTSYSFYGIVILFRFARQFNSPPCSKTGIYGPKKARGPDWSLSENLCVCDFSFCVLSVRGFGTHAPFRVSRIESLSKA